MTIESPVFHGADATSELTPVQNLLIRNILSILPFSYMGRRDMHIKVPNFPACDVTVGHDGYKLIVKSPEHNIFAKVYYTPVHAQLVGAAVAGISRVIRSEEFAKTHTIVDCQEILGLMDRAVIFKYDQNIIGEDTDLTLDDRMNLLMEFQKFMPETLKGKYARFLCPPSILRMKDGSMKFSDFVYDGYTELEEIRTELGL